MFWSPIIVHSQFKIWRQDTPRKVTTPFSDHAHLKLKLEYIVLQFLFPTSKSLYISMSKRKKNERYLRRIDIFFTKLVVFLVPRAATLRSWQIRTPFKISIIDDTVLGDNCLNFTEFNFHIQLQRYYCLALRSFKDLSPTSCTLFSQNN